MSPKTIIFLFFLIVSFEFALFSKLRNQIEKIEKAKENLRKMEDELDNDLFEEDNFNFMEKDDAEDPELFEEDEDPILLEKMDKIYLMKDGTIIKEGTFKDLLKDTYFDDLIAGVFEK